MLFDLDVATQICHNLGKGKIFDANNIENVNSMISLYTARRNGATSPLWIPYTDQSKEGEFSNIYDTRIVSLPWSPGQPNGEAQQNCASTSVVHTGYVVDVFCTKEVQAICEFTDAPSFKLKGLSLDSGIDTMYYMQNSDYLVEYIGYMDTILRFNSNTSNWSMYQKGKQIGQTSAHKEGLLLGK